MTYKPGRHALDQYRDVGTKANVQAASPHRLIALLLEGAMTRITTAIGHLQRGAIGAKCQDLTVALSIIGGLRGSLDLERGGLIAGNLDNLYDYMQRRLLLANARNDIDSMEEVVSLLREVKTGWDGIDPDATGTAPRVADVEPPRVSGTTYAAV